MSETIASSRPLKRQKLANGSIDQSINQSINCFVDVAPDVFTLIFSFLTLSEKLAKLPHLSHSINQRFDPSLHCRNDSVSINQSTFDNVVHSRLFDRLMSAVPVIDLQLIEDYTENDTVPVTNAHSKPESINRSIDNQSVDQSVDLSISQAVHKSANQSISHPISPFMSVARAILGNKLKTFRYSENQPVDPELDQPVIFDLCQLVKLVKSELAKQTNESPSSQQVNQSIDQSTSQSINQSISQSMSQSINPFIHQSISQITRSTSFVELFICLQVVEPSGRWGCFESDRPIDLTCLFGRNLHSLTLDVTPMNFWCAPIERFLDSDRLIDSLEFCDPEDGRCVMLERTLRALPPTLTYLKMVTGMWDDDASELQKALLADDTWLPHIRHFELTQPFSDVPELLTVMKSTGQVRPYTWLSIVSISQHVTSHQFPHLEHFSLHAQTAVIPAVNQTFYQSINQLWIPNLKSLEFDLDASGIVDINPLVVFASNRPIEKLRIRMELAHFQLFQDLSDQSIQSIGGMHLLTSLELDISPSWLDSRAIERLIGHRCWPNLKSMKLMHLDYTSNSFTALLNAAPNLEDIYVDIRFQHRHLPLLCIFDMQACPLLRSVYMKHSPYRRHEDVDEEFLEFFNAVHVRILPNLRDLQVWYPRLDNKALHILIAKMANVSIEKFMFPNLLWSCDDDEKKKELTAFQLIMQRNLRHLTTVWPGNSGVESPCVQGMQRTLADGVLFPFEDLGESILKFSIARDEHGRDGREAFFHHVYELLNDEEKTLLAAWDRGEYNFQ